MQKRRKKEEAQFIERPKKRLTNQWVWSQNPLHARVEMMFRKFRQSIKSSVNVCGMMCAIIILFYFIDSRFAGEMQTNCSASIFVPRKRNKSEGKTSWSWLFMSSRNEKKKPNKFRSSIVCVYFFLEQLEVMLASEKLLQTFASNTAQLKQ